jgi:hypothetical protein
MQTSIYDTSPEHFAFGGGAQDTTLHPAVAVAMVVTIVLMLLLPRKYIVAPLFLFIFLVPNGQQIYQMGVHFHCSRILILFGCARLLWSRLFQSGTVLAGGFNAIDGVFTAWALYRALAVILLFLQMGAVVNQMGFLWDALGMYFLLRFLIQDQDDIERVFKVFAVVAVVIAAEMVHEHYTTQNLFGTILGGIRPHPEIRGGLVRAQAVFQHALLAGSFGAALFPLFVWLWKSGQSKVLATVGMISSAVITLAASTSTPILAFVAGIGAICMWPLRSYLRVIRYGVVTALVALHLVMKAPVWFLIARIGVMGGSNGYHRAELVDLFVRHFGDWWLIGTNQNANWGWDMWDTANQYVTEGETGGLVAFICFLALIFLSFRNLAKARTAAGGDRNKQWFFWLLGASLFVHCVAYFGIDYFDQNRFAWYALLAMISAATFPFLGTKTSPALHGDMALSGPLVDYAYPSPSRPPREVHVSRMAHVNTRPGSTGARRGIQGKFEKL